MNLGMVRSGHPLSRDLMPVAFGYVRSLDAEQVHDAAGRGKDGQADDDDQGGRRDDEFAALHLRRMRSTPSPCPATHREPALP